MLGVTIKQFFLTYAKSDRGLRERFVAEALERSIPIQITEMTVKKPWDEQWKTQCRYRIRGSSGLIALISPNLESDAGALWEVRCAVGTGTPILGIYAAGAGIANCPEVLLGKNKANWDWDEISRSVGPFK